MSHNKTNHKEENEVKSLKTWEEALKELPRFIQKTRIEEKQNKEEEK